MSIEKTMNKRGETRMQLVEQQVISKNHKSRLGSS